MNEIPPWYAEVLAGELENLKQALLSAEEVPPHSYHFPSSMIAAIYILTAYNLKRDGAFTDVVKDKLLKWYEKSYIHSGSPLDPVAIKSNLLTLDHLPPYYEAMGGLFLPSIGWLYVVTDIKGNQEVIVYEV